MANFKVHARVLDLLGDEQIADCPTAISELFKNAYDAYSSKVNLDVYTDDDKAILWDDGHGMSESDIVNRWLVVGTPEKKIQDFDTEISTGLAKRPIMGEKGIGRLAISTLGDTLLMITKQTIHNKANYSALLINWNIVRNDKLLLSDIYVPVVSLTALEDLSENVTQEMVKSFLSPIVSEDNSDLWKDYGSIKSTIVEQLSNFKIDLTALKRTGIEKISSGTAFYISNITPDLPLYLKAPSRDESDKETPQALLVQLLGSFQARKDPLTQLKIHDQEKNIDFQADVRSFDQATARFKSVFKEWDTFNEDDLSSADHHIKVNFDEFGNYSGNLRRYDERYPLTSQIFNSKNQLACGPFSMEFWYWQGEDEATRLNKEQKVLIEKKLSLFGGVLLYRDDLRVLPYGRPEFDWLKIEERRTLKAGRHFFSYRRMFGSVSITKKMNPGLRDKAGREGLKLNKQYREFRQTLISFLGDLARRYFGESESFKEKKAEIEARQALLKKEQNKVKARREKLEKDLNQKIKIINENQDKAIKLLEISLSKLHALSKSNSATDVVQANIEFENRIGKLEEEARYSIPENLSTGRVNKLNKLKYDYEEKWSEFRKLCLLSRREFSSAITKEMPDIAAASIRKKSIENALLRARSRIGKAHAQVRQRVDEIQLQLDSALHDLKREHLSELEDCLLKLTFSKTIEQAESSQIGELSEILAGLESVALHSEMEADAYSSSVGDHFNNFLTGSSDATSAAQNDELEYLREQVSQNFELVQLGLSVEIIDHDLQKTYRGIKSSLVKLQRIWKDAPRSLGILGEVAANFQHLEQRYQLMSPLYRNSYRSKVDITGDSIYKYLLDFLDHELDVHGITLNATEEFLNITLRESAARILPVFINIIDNSIYWTREEKERIVELGVCNDTITVNDSGVGIHPTMLHTIFNPFFSNKPSGRGLGLYIAKTNLETAGHSIYATNDEPYRTLGGACICIVLNKNTFPANIF